MTIKMSGHPPFPAQVILNGHEHVAAQARAAGIGFAKELVFRSFGVAGAVVADGFGACERVFGKR